MNQGLEILIARTKTHPQEFFGWETGAHIASRWVNMMENFTHHMTEEEKSAWEEAKVVLNEWYANKRRDDFTEAVMKELLAPEEDDGLGKWYTKQGNITLSAGQTQGVSLNSGVV